jgi:hypothetical protein
VEERRLPASEVGPWERAPLAREAMVRLDSLRMVRSCPQYRGKVGAFRTGRGLSGQFLMEMGVVTGVSRMISIRLAGYQSLFSPIRSGAGRP